MTFRAYYEEHYKPAHADPLCRAFHWIGLAVAIGVVIGVAISSGLSWWWMLAAPLPIYLFGMVGHLLTGTRPQCVKAPLWSIAAYFVMLHESIVLSADAWSRMQE